MSQDPFEATAPSAGTQSGAPAAIALSSDFLRRYDVPGPRYTSYPPAPHFRDDLERASVEALFGRSNTVGTRRLSFYFHIPFCPKQCLFCGCTTEIGKPGSLVLSYMDALHAEMEARFAHLDPGRPVTQIHFGGGTPNSVPFKHLAGILDRVRSRFELAPSAEVAIECDPNLLTEKKLGELRAMGFNRISFGLQDFDRETLAAVNRDFPRIPPREMIAMARGLGFRGVNLDLIYGLPHQTPERFRDTIARTVEAGPDRVATFSYAHVPWIKPHQAVLEERDLPGGEAKLEMLLAIVHGFQDAGYVAIGMDHYARPDDDLALSLRDNLLHRNFQGYCSRRTTGQVVAFGASAISQLHEGYVQNVKDAASYIRAIGAGEPVHERAYVLSEDDQFHRHVINSIMCNCELDLAEAGTQFGLGEDEVRARLSEAIERLPPYVEDGLATWDGRVLRVSERGRLVVRCIAMLFDPLLGEQKARYSRTV